jgi:hypothetical protein
VVVQQKYGDDAIVNKQINNSQPLGVFQSTGGGTWPLGGTGDWNH